MKPTRGECGALGQERSSDVRTGGSPVWLDVVRVGISRHDEEGAQAKPRGEVGSKEGFGCDGDRRWPANLMLPCSVGTGP